MLGVKIAGIEELAGTRAATLAERKERLASVDALKAEVGQIEGQLAAKRARIAELEKTKASVLALLPSPETRARLAELRTEINALLQEIEAHAEDVTAYTRQRDEHQNAVQMLHQKAQKIEKQALGLIHDGLVADFIQRNQETIAAIQALRWVSLGVPGALGASFGATMENIVVLPTKVPGTYDREARELLPAIRAEFGLSE
jgi:chromosome segregation ATPase